MTASPAGHWCVRGAQLPVLVLLLALLIGMPSLLGGTSAQAGSARLLPAQDTPRIELHLDRVVPTVLQPGRAWAVRGRIENVSDATVQMDQVRLLTAYQPLDTAAALDGWISGNQDVETTRLLGAAGLGRPLPPGEGRDFLVFVPSGEVDPPFAFASLPLRLEASAGDGFGLGELRTVLPWFGDATVQDPLDVSWVVPLTVPPDPELNSETGPQRTQAWLDVVGAQSPARAWLDGLAEHEATFVVDPSLLVPLAPATDVSATPPEQPIPLPEPGPRTTAPGPPARTSAPASSPGTGEDGASTSTPAAPPVDLPEDLTRVQEAELALQTQLGGLRGDQLWWLPVADPDLASMIDIAVDPDVSDRVLAASLPPSVLQAERLLTRGRRDVSWPAWSSVTQEQLAAVQTLSPSLDVSAVVLPRSAFTDANGRNSAPQGIHDGSAGDLTLLGYDDTLSSLVSDLPAADRDGAQIQLLLGYTLARYQRSPAESGAVIIAPDRGATVEADT
ncbi:MAG: hypothetical protein WA962_06130, partial [Ornithinimicrobium sp.]